LGVSSEKSKKYQSGWRQFQFQQYRDYVQPVLGKIRLNAITPQMVKRVLNRVAMMDRSPGTQRHVFVLMRKMMFGDAIESYQYLTFNPAIRKFKPDIPFKEAKRLNLEQIKRLLLHVDGKKYGLAIWLQLYVGLRCGELQALRWEDIDLEDGRLHIRRTYVRKMAQFRDYPKGRKQHSPAIPQELCDRLAAAREKSLGELVCPSPIDPKLVLPQRWYGKALKRYCKELEIPTITSHGLRHSTSEIYMSHGASRDDLRQVFAHSSATVTDRYIRDRASNLEKVSNVIRLFKNDEPVLESKTYPKNVPDEKQEVKANGK
jgi:integrase